MSASACAGGGWGRLRGRRVVRLQFNHVVVRVQGRRRKEVVVIEEPPLRDEGFESRPALRRGNRRAVGGLGGYFA
jgi:hypothetical protein